MPSKVWDELLMMSYRSPSFNGATAEVWECMSNFIPYIMMDVIIYPGLTQEIWGVFCEFKSDPRYACTFVVAR